MNGLIILSLSALVVGVTMGLLGSGGSILTVPILVYLVGLDEKTAIASSLAIVGAIAALTSLLNIRSGSIDWRTTVWFGVPGVAGTYGGAAVSEFASGAFQLLVFAGVMLMSAYFMLRPPRLKSEPVPQKIWVIICEGLVIGGLTGFVGVGGGFLIVPALVLLGGLSLSRAAATSLIIIAVKSGAGLIKYLELLGNAGSTLDWFLIGSFVGFGMVGSLIGRRLGQIIPQRQAEQVFSVFLIAIAAWILFQSAGDHGLIG